jgi:hypothetical protein
MNWQSASLLALGLLVVGCIAILWLSAWHKKHYRRLPTVRVRLNPLFHVGRDCK